jgi:hypothetical protein
MASVWYNWMSTSATNYTITSSSSTSYTTTDTAWMTWTADTGTTTGDYIWYKWVEAPVTSGGVVYYGSADPEEVVEVNVPKMTRDRIRQRARTAQMAIERTWRKILADELQAEKEAAEVKAKELLLDLIGPEQLKVFEETGRLFVRGRNHDYIVREGHKHIRKITKDKVIDLCVHIPLSLPSTDNVIALKLALEADEDEVVRIANYHGSVPFPIDFKERYRAACM